MTQNCATQSQHMQVSAQQQIAVLAQERDLQRTELEHRLTGSMAIAEQFKTFHESARQLQEQTANEYAMLKVRVTQHESELIVLRALTTSSSGHDASQIEQALRDMYNKMLQEYADDRTATITAANRSTTIARDESSSWYNGRQRSSGKRLRLTTSSLKD